MNDSFKEGRDSWLVKQVFGKKEAAVVETKLRRQVAAVLLGLDMLFWGSAGKLMRGFGQQP